MAISGHVSRRMIEHYPHTRMDARRRATDAIVEGGVNQNVNQVGGQSCPAPRTRDREDASERADLFYFFIFVKWQDSEELNVPFSLL
jgi:hypothetical protein